MASSYIENQKENSSTGTKTNSKSSQNHVNFLLYFSYQTEFVFLIDI